MFCPRCGRPVNAEANFCGGCGLSKVEIEKYISKTAPQQEVKAEYAPQQEMPKTEPVFVQPEEKAPEAEIPQQEAPKAEPVFTESETVKAEDARTSYADNNCTYAYSYKKAENTDAASHQTGGTANSCASNATDAAYTAATAEIKAEAPLSTVDFIWLFVISSLPVIGLIYLVYLAVQNNNTNKRSFARATLIVGVFSVIITLLFAGGIVAAGIF